MKSRCIENLRRLQVGCGPKHIRSAWWNVDIREFAGIDQVMDVTMPWPWADLLDYVYGEHFLEHLDLNGAIRFLVEAGTSLRRGGRLRLSTPSLEWVMATHFDPLSTDAAKQLRQTIGINRAFYGWGHRFLYSHAFLNHTLTSLGYEDVKFHSYGESHDLELVGLEMHGGYSVALGFPSVWIVEATRGGKPIAEDLALSEMVDREFLAQVRSGH